MKYPTFEIFWKECFINGWLKTTKILKQGILTSVDELCSFKETAINDVYKAYESVKETTKSLYFKNYNEEDASSVHLNKYKRAAVLTCAVIKADPLIIKHDCISDGMDELFLKQNLAFNVGLQSILQEFPQEDLKKYKGFVGEFFDFSNKAIFNFSDLGRIDRNPGDDDFLASVYKDLFFAEIHQNYNVLTMANIYGLLVERASIVGLYIFDKLKEEETRKRAKESADS